MPELALSLAQLRGAWMAGRSALEHCPAEWRDAIALGRAGSTSADSDAECALAALAGHATMVLFRPVPAAPLAPRPLLPVLALPTIPESVRPRLRRVLAALKGATSLERSLFDFVTARGFTLHPADWMPSPRDDEAPDVYAPWLDWVRGEAEPAPSSVLDLDTYDRWPFARRRAALLALREEDPGAARALIAAKASSEPAERRLGLVAILETRLSEDDGEVLEALAKDRSDRVQTLARAYLARLGRETGTDALATELAAMVDIGKVGLLRRRRRLEIKTLKTAAQNTRRRELFKLVSFTKLARALGFSGDQLLEAAPVGAADGIDALVQMVATTGSRDAARRLLDLILEDASLPLAHARPLAPRLTAQERRSLLAPIIKRDADLFGTSLALMGPMLGEAPLAALLASPGFAALKSAIEAARTGDEAQRAATSARADSALRRVALLITASAATELIARLRGLGFSPADPKLDALHLNAALTPQTRPWETRP